MSWLFGGKKKASGKTVLMLDVESGSVAAGLVRLSKGKPPRLFAETRVHIPLLRTRDAVDLTVALEKAAKEALQHTSTVAARIRNSSTVAPLGDISEAEVFLHAPWSTPVARPQSWDWKHEPVVTQMLIEALQPNFDTLKATFHPFANAAIHTSNAVFDQQDNFLMCILTGEVAELLLVQNGTYTGRATIPMGVNLPLRTLQSHGGMSVAEAQSILALAKHANHQRYKEPLTAAGRHFMHAFASAVKEIALDSKVHSVLIIGKEPGATWAARALSEHAPVSQDLFADNAVVRALNTRHLLPHIAAHAPQPDAALLVETIFIDNFN